MNVIITFVEKNNLSQLERKIISNMILFSHKEQAAKSMRAEKGGSHVGKNGCKV